MRNVDVSETAIEQPRAGSIGSLARTGIAWSAGLIVTRQVLGLVVTSIMARLLLPGDYGLIGMVTTMFALLNTFGDMGLSWATIQRKNLTQAQSHNLFWINAGVGVVLSIACLVIAPVLAAFYGEERLVPVTMVMGVSFAFGGLAVQPLALMRRQMQFKHLTLMQLGQYCTGAVVAITLAALGAGYWALVVQAVTVQAISLVLAFRVSGYRPMKPRRGIGTVGLLRFGGYLSASGLMIYFQRNLDYVLIGRMLGVEELGYYTRAYFLMMLPATLAAGTLGSVMIPSLSALQENPERFGHAYRKAVRWIAGLSFPIAAGLALVSREAVRLVYGDQWLPVVPILAWLSLVSLTQPIYNTYGWLFTAAGKGRPYFLSTIGATAVLVTAFAIGIQWGVVGLAAWYALAMTFAVTVPMLYFAHRAAGLNFPSTLRTLIPATTATALMSIGVVLLGIVLDALRVSWMLQLVLKSFLGAGIYLPVWLILDSEMRSTVLQPWRTRIWRPSST
jgi:PST family polysaccharide transporter